jgi:pimeloyl-ACP methyl ester carboxylesterase
LQSLDASDRRHARVGSAREVPLANVNQERAVATTITEHELEQCERANSTGRTPVVFIHGLWLLPSSWERWAALFEEAG